MVRWMSGLVTGLQNRLQRFESASDLTKTALEIPLTLFFFCIVIYWGLQKIVPEALGLRDDKKSINTILVIRGQCLPIYKQIASCTASSILGTAGKCSVGIVETRIGYNIIVSILE